MIKLKYDEESYTITCVYGIVDFNAVYAEQYKCGSFDFSSLVTAYDDGNGELSFYTMSENLCDGYDYFDDLELYPVNLVLDV